MFFNLLFYLFFLFTFFMVFMLYFTVVNDNIFILDYCFLFLDCYMDFNLLFYFDYLSNIFLLIVSLISMTTFFYSKFYMDLDKNKNKFLFLTLIFVLSMNMVVLSYNFVLILVGWDCLGIISYFLVIHYNSDNSDYSGITTVMTNRIGDIGMIFCIYLAICLGDYNFYILSSLELSFGLFFFFICVSGFTKSAQFPFSVWLPLAMAAPTPISALVHSSTLVTAGVYLFIRFDYLFKLSNNLIMFFLILVGFTMLVASSGAFFELDVKKIIAYSTLSQISLMMMVVIMGNEIFSFFHILTHALFKALLFLCSGILIHGCFDNQDIRCYNFNLKLNLVVVSMFTICSMSLMGFPFLSGFYSKDLILEMVYILNYNVFFVVLLIFNTLITGAYSFRVIFYSMLMGKKNMALLYYSDWENINKSLFILLPGVIFLGSLVYWMLMLKFDLLFMSIYLKLVNLILVFFCYLLFLLIKNNNYLLSYLNYFLSMFFMKSYQGFLLGKVFNNFLMMACYSEYYMEYMLFSKFNLFLKNFSMMVLMFKIFMFYYGFLFLFLLMNFDIS
uniref:NADH-ubiquinone oxidoreductase chain 5 n=1 Tax=Euseius sacchari TaxID=3061191 RepID=A0AAU6PCM0_9ACAR